MPISTEDEANVLIAQQAAVQASMKDLKSFCEWNRMGRVAKSTKGNVREQYDAAQAEGDKDKAAKILLENVRYENPWASSVSGHLLLKDRSRDKSVKNGALGPDLTINDIASFADTGLLRGKSNEESFDLPSQLTRASDDTLQVSTTKKIGACGYVGSITSVPSCLNNIDQIIRYAAPVGNKKGGLTSRPSFVKILSGKDYTVGLKIAVQKMHKKFSSRKSSGDLFSDIQDSFVESGDSKENASEKTWEVMAALAAAGPNMYSRVSFGIGKKINPNALYLTGIATMIPHLDTDAMNSSPAHLYSLPPGIDFPCDSGKSYHFWMSAYLSRMLVKNGSTPEDARVAAYISEIGYQTHSETLGRRPNSISKWQRFGDTELGVQMDLNLAAAGSHFGANQGSADQKIKPKYNLTENFQSSINNLGTDPSGDANDSWVELMGGQRLRWLNNYNPLSTLKSYDR